MSTAPPLFLAGAALLVGLAACLASCPASADERIALVVGHNLGGPDTDPLRYAEADAERVYEVLLELGNFSSRSLLLLSPTESELDAAIGRVAAMTSADPAETMLLFYFAGHGDAESAHLGSTRVPRAELLARLAEAGAGLTMVVFDACQTPVSGQLRGVGAAPSFEIGVVDHENVAGRVIIASTEEGLPALESATLGGSLFTHYFVSGLRGSADANSDGRITLAESYTWAHDQTIRQSAGSSAAIQRPTFDLELEGTGELVLTQLDWGDATLEVPPSEEGRLLVFRQQTGAMVAELFTSPAHPTRLAVPAGRLLLQQRRADSVALAEIEVGRGETRVVDAAEFASFPYAEVALRGGRYDLYPNRLLAAYRFGAEQFGDAWALGHGVAAEYGRSWLDWRLGVEAQAAFASYRDGSFEHDDWLLGLGVTLGWLRPLALGRLALSAGPMLRLVHQTRQRSDRERLVLGGVEADPDTDVALGAGPIMGLAWEVPVSQFFGLEVRVDGGVWLLNLVEDGRSELRPAPFLGAGVGGTLRF